MNPIKKIAFCAVVKELTNADPFITFLKNAQKYNHDIEHLIVLYTDFMDNLVVEELRNYVNVTALKAGSENDMKTLNEEEVIAESDLYYFLFDVTESIEKVPFGTIRNSFLVAGLIHNVDALLFIDVLAAPKLLREQEEDQYYFQEIDFVKCHLQELEKSNFTIMTTSAFTGFSFLPKFQFDNLNNLLIGLQKEDLNDFLFSNEPNIPFTQDHSPKYCMDTDEAFVGNMAIDLRKFKALNPFYSSSLNIDGKIYLGHQDITFFAPALKHNDFRCIDVDARIFKDYQRNYPQLPNLDSEKAIDTLYNYCLGHVIRNPFLNWLRKEYYPKTKEMNRNYRYRSIVTGSEFAAEHFQDNRFMHLPIAFELAYNQLPLNIEKYKSIDAAWKQIKGKLDN